MFTFECQCGNVVSNVNKLYKIFMSKLDVPV